VDWLIGALSRPPRKPDRYTAQQQVVVRWSGKQQQADGNQLVAWAMPGERNQEPGHSMAVTRVPRPRPTSHAARRQPHQLALVCTAGVICGLAADQRDNPLLAIRCRSLLAASANATVGAHPYCKGDRIELSEEEQKDVDALTEPREVSNPYKVVEDPRVPESTETVKAVEEPDGERVKPVPPQDAAEANLTAPGIEAEQAVEAEREAKAAQEKSK
jgi:hypothetical protein